jgi:clan AA aspartic protease (TIGR02281 family)
MRLAQLPPIVALALACMLAPTPDASAEIYRWVDREGRLHFTEQLERVPRAHRRAARDRARRANAAPLQTYSGRAPAAQAQARGLSRYDKEVRVPFVADGTLMRITARVNDLVDAPFLIDTGASGISLPSHVAEDLGIRVRPDTPTVRVTTANGVVSRAVVTLRSVELGRARVENLEATINPSMKVGLLGGNFFNNFVYRVDAAESVITLVPNEQIRGGLRAKDWKERFESLRDPLARLEAHLESGEVRRKGERAELERRRTTLQARLEELEVEANRLDVPQAWRE